MEKMDVPSADAVPEVAPTPTGPSSASPEDSATDAGEERAEPLASEPPREGPAADTPIAAPEDSQTEGLGAAQSADRAPATGSTPPPAENISPDVAEQAQDDNEDLADPAKAKQLRLEGNEYFKAGRFYDAREAYSEALHVSPPGDAASDRAVLHCNRAACLQKLGRWDDAVKDCSEAVELDPTYVKAFARRSTAYEELKRWHDALEDLKKAIELEPELRGKESRRLAVLEKRAQEQFEKDKDEMLSKLKDLGNTVLGKFGMSTDNFKMEQDPDTGSYSIKFQS